MHRGLLDAARVEDANPVAHAIRFLGPTAGDGEHSAHLVHHHEILILVDNIQNLFSLHFPPRRA